MGLVTCVTAFPFSVVIWITLLTLLMDFICTYALADSSQDGSADPRCERVGQLLEDNTSACHYLVCQHGSAVFKQIHGDHSYMTRRMPCAPGTYVLSDFTDTGYSDQQSPCVGTGHNCAVSPKYYKRRYKSNKVNHGYVTFRQVAGPTGKKAVSVRGGDTRRLRQLVGLLQNIVHDETIIFSSLPKDGLHDAQVAAVDRQWTQVHRQVDDMLSTLTPGTDRVSDRAAVSLNLDPRTLHKFSHKMMALILRVMRLTAKTEELMRRLDEGSPSRGMLKLSAGDMEGSSKAATRPAGRVGGMHHSTDVFMMRSLMDKLRKEGRGAGPKYPKYMHAGYTRHADRRYGDYEEARTRRSGSYSRQTNEVEPAVPEFDEHSQDNYEPPKVSPAPPPGPKLHNLPTRPHFRSYLRTQMMKSLHLPRRRHHRSPTLTPPDPKIPSVGSSSASPQQSYRQPPPQPQGTHPNPGPGNQGLQHRTPTWLHLGTFGRDKKPLPVRTSVSKPVFDDADKN